MRISLLPCALLLTAITLRAAAQPGELTPQQAARYQALVSELRCLVCQNQSIADSNAPLAADLREQVRSQILAGRSDEAIRDYVTARYGDFVLYRPPFKPSTWMLWVGPFLLLAAALAFTLRFVRRSPRASAAPVDPNRLQRLLDEESK
ncbi:cytochrome c-type biogenesis protein [Sinimarinibacterium thermocellulolyticum]|uniref:Cytochrome c-type biogenesis protein n=1 Tax=Sinimarinibacterium thermocellulolyticum TaxID=3170016 RepID=A0ABV2A880_9GAMM